MMLMSKLSLAAEDNPWLIVTYGMIIVIPIILLSLYIISKGGNQEVAYLLLMHCAPFSILVAVVAQV